MDQDGNRRMTKGELTECLTRINGTFCFDVKKYLGFDPKSENIIHFYKTDVESFFNTRKDLHRCQNCGAVDSKINLQRMTIHDDDECLRQALLHFVWFKMAFWEKWFPQLSYFLGNMEKYYFAALKWSEFNKSKMYSTIVRENNDKLVGDWDLQVFEVKYPKDKYEQIEELLAQFKNKKRVGRHQYT